MSTRLSKRKTKRSSPENIQVETEAVSRTETESILSEQDFNDITNKVENSLSKKVKETSDFQREMMKILMEMKTQIAAINERENVNPIEVQVENRTSESENRPSTSAFPTVDNNIQMEETSYFNTASRGSRNTYSLETYVLGKIMEIPWKTM